MEVTLEELKERIKQEVDEVTLLEILNITTAQLVEAFEDKILDKKDTLTAELFDDEEV